ncbi:hypothetical protein HX823_09430 [Pseudomonas sp. P7759]|uniref:hypothetical protein n=1 Tax=Pseudomonas sp. P7759 TaxID=2738831 RepID=UPI0015A48572|nr:hypothetical protein [Pseudomonas sp. P7759]NWC74298.1 hypothetical protein [Pseudomonas sp. P7759]
MAKINKRRLFVVVLLILMAPSLWIAAERTMAILESAKKENTALLTKLALERHVASTGMSMDAWRLKLEADCRREMDLYISDVKAGKAEVDWLSNPQEAASQGYDLCIRGGSYLTEFPTAFDNTVFAAKKYSMQIFEVILILMAPVAAAWFAVFAIPFAVRRLVAWVTTSATDNK